VPPTDERHAIPVENPWGKLLDAPGVLTAKAGAVGDFFRAAAAERGGNCKAALEKLSDAERAIDLPALHFVRARCLERIGAYPDALSEYALWHFPEPTCGPSLRAAIRGVAAKEGVPLADVDAAWRRASPSGFPDSALFVDDHHLSLEGYRRAAALIADALSRNFKLPISARPAEPNRTLAQKARPHFLLGHLYSIWSSEPDPSLGFDREFHRRAVEEFVAALRDDPTLDDADGGPDAVTPTAEVNLAVADERLGLRQKALAHLRRAFALRPRPGAAEAAFDLTVGDPRLSVSAFIPPPATDFAPLFGVQGRRLKDAWMGPRAGILVKLPERPRRARLVFSVLPETLRRGPVEITAYFDGRRLASARMTKQGEAAFSLPALGGGGKLGVLELRFDKSVIPAAEGLSSDVEPLGGVIKEAEFL
jgi:tetratricopeptide (TPR) repeat protein